MLLQCLVRSGGAVHGLHRRRSYSLVGQSAAHQFDLATHARNHRSLFQGCTGGSARKGVVEKCGGAVPAVEMSKSSPKKIPEGTLMAVGFSAIIFAVVGLWYN